MTKKELEEIICSTLDIKSLTNTIKKQITKFVVKRGLKYEDIAHAITFYIEVKNKKPELKYGIAFVDWAVEDAKRYYKRKEIEDKKRLNSLKRKKESNDIVYKVTKIKKRKPLEKVDMTKLDDESD